MRDDVRSVPHLAGVPLTLIERRIMALTAAGRTLAGIAYELGIPERRVRRLRARIQEKYGASNAPHAVAIWLGREAIDMLVTQLKEMTNAEEEVRPEPNG